MSGRKRRWTKLPSVEELMRERTHERYRIRYRRALRSTITTIITVAAVAVIISYLLMPVLRIYGYSMTPTVHDGNIVLTLRSSNFTKGDVIAFYYNNKILVKRVIAGPGEWVDIDQNGQVYVNEEPIDEPYIDELAYGECNIELPYQVPENRWFVMGDKRSVSIDSRNTAVGCVSDEQIVGRIFARIWPLNEIGIIRRGGVPSPIPGLMTEVTGASQEAAGTPQRAGGTAQSTAGVSQETAGTAQGAAAASQGTTRASQGATGTPQETVGTSQEAAGEAQTN